ncbi:MAG TPA: DMT family transporter [Candidatus Atribacteria bacterium]|uniref:DMT family transporter n=1 Tax=Candidatus Sordicultor fermentans TaxID=1953203 RepID=UPI002A2FE0DE|nr:DMT family transporter [Atribacterota bacterium]HOA99089.1 DMT family transporter [Candidatus Atribacteria bacterium]MDI9608495.1 DMT family transporter [Atribacterota bacterium]HOQ51020.1 DMT family transporter [Candidatus Atribacteria bacterium]HPT63502.1 DMT family transporter [Candidatus Atribacteria bacterium]
MDKKYLSHPYFLLILVSLIWGFNFSVVKMGIMAIGPLAFSFLRFILSALLMFFVLYITEKNPWVEVKDLPYFLFLGLLGFGIYQPLWSYGLKLSLASHSALILSLSPVVVSLVAFLRKEELVGGINLLGVIVGFGGVMFLVSQGGSGDYSSESVLYGDLLTLGAAISWGLYSYFGKNMVKKYSPLKTSTWSILWGLMFMFPICIGETLQIRAEDFSFSLLLSLSYSVVLSSLVAYIIWMQCVREIGATRTVSSQYITQVVGVIAAWMIFGEPLGWQVFLGMAFISLGLWLVNRKPQVEELTP